MIDRYFGIAAAGSNIPRELRAGLTTFLTMSYVLLVNPAVLGNAIIIPDGFPKLLVVTALAAAIGSLLMGLVARYPFAQAPGMGLNAYFAFTVVLGQKSRGRPPSARSRSPDSSSSCSRSSARAKRSCAQYPTT